MPKFKIVCVLLAAVIAAAGTILVIKNFSGEDIPFFEKPTDDPNTYMELTDSVDITDTDVDVREYLFIAHKVLLEGKGFYGVSTGSTTAAGIQQNVLNTRYVVGEFGNKNTLKEMVTKGIVSNAYQLYMWGNNYIYRTGRVNTLEDVKWSTDAQPLNEDSFYNDFGHRSDKLTGYILNWDTVLSGELTSVEDGVYTFRYVLDTNEATTYLRREMITNGNLKGEPTFTKCVIYVAMDADFNIKSLRTDCAYKANVGVITADCSEDIIEIIEPYEGDLPYADFYEDYLDQQGGNLDKEKTAVDVLMEMFSPYLAGEDLQVELVASSKNKELANALLSISGLDISDLTKLQLAAKLGDVNVSYFNSEGAIYVKYQDFQASTTVEGIMGFVDTLTQLLGDNVATNAVDSSLLGDFDASSLLENLTFTLYDNDTKCVVNLPISIANLVIEANLYADVDGESYSFTHATVTVGDVELVIKPRAWNVEEIDKGAYPEILGLADLIENGKLALTANIGLTLGESNYTAIADVLVDLATANVRITAQLDKYGEVTATLADGVAYVAFGGIKVKLDTANVEQLLEQIQKIVGDVTVETPSVSVNAILAAISGITATKVDDDVVAFKLSFGGVDAALYLKNNGGRWQLDTIVVTADGVDLTVAPSDKLDDVTKPRDAADYADVNELIDTFYDPIASLFDANGYEISFDGSVTIDGKAYGLSATLTLSGGNVHAIFQLSYDGIYMIKDGELWVLDGVLYLHAGDLKLAIEIGEPVDSHGNFSIESLKATLENVKGYNDSVDTVVELVLSLLDTQLDSLAFDEIVSAMFFKNGNLTVYVDGSQFGLSNFTLGLSAEGGLTLSLKNLSYKNITLNVKRATVAAYDGEVIRPGANEDFTTNLVIDVQTYDNANANGEHNVIYVNIDLLNGVVLARIETEMQGGVKSHLDFKYTFADNVLKLTNGKELNVLVNINNIADIVDRINDIVNDFAGAGDQALPDLFGSLGGDVDLRAIVKSLFIHSENGEVLVDLTAMGMNVTVTFKGGLKSVTVPVDVIESNLVVTLSGHKAKYSNFTNDNSKYVSIDQVFDDYYYGEDGVESDNNGPIYKLVHTNSWKFDFHQTVEIDVRNDDGSTTIYQIMKDSYIVFYYNKTEVENSKIRANLTVQKDREEFLYLDVAYFDGRIYATYDSNKKDNGNVLKATVSLDAIKETIDLLPALIEVVPQIGTLMDSMKDAMSNAESKLTLGNVSQILNSVSYVDRVFTLEINGQAIDANNFGDDPITLKVSEYNDIGLRLDELSLSYGNVSVNLGGIVVTGSDKNQETDEFEYVEQYIYSYDTTNHMNFDSIRELLSSFIITANDHDAEGNRHFRVDGTIHAKALGLVDVDMPISIQVDITKDNVVYLAVKLVREKIGLGNVTNLMFEDRGGDSYLYYNGETGMVKVVRNSYRVKNLVQIYLKENDYVANVTAAEFMANIADYLLEMVNFADSIESQIRDALNSENTNVYGIEDILKDYYYTESSKTYSVVADLEPIDSMLGTLTMTITHDDEYRLQSLNGSISVVKKIINLNIKLNLKDAVAWQAKSYVESGQFWSF